ncbi:MAG: tRNA isopentenyl-2-thiomethyl-A-37 hydroxylase MiaE [Myxococcota bacterium]
MLHLLGKTHPDWAEMAANNLDLILVDHAHLEKKAAANALALLFRYPEHVGILQPLSELAREELVHFELVLSHLISRGIRFERIHPCPYAGRLHTVMAKNDPERMLDTLLVAAVIEARSAERMRLLADRLAEKSAADAVVRLYRGLLAAEARHHVLFVELAESIFPADRVRKRLEEVAAHEASILEFRPDEPRLHG